MITIENFIMIVSETFDGKAWDERSKKISVNIIALLKNNQFMCAMRTENDDEALVVLRRTSDAGGWNEGDWVIEVGKSRFNEDRTWKQSFVAYKDYPTYVKIRKANNNAYVQKSSNA